MGSESPVPNRSTIKDVAAEAGVSISTVSLVMNDKGYVSAGTRIRVRVAAGKLRFAPRPAARALPTRRTGNVGFVLRHDHFRRTEPFYTGIYLGTEFEADLQGRYVLLTTIQSSYTPGVDTPRFLKERNVDGILVAGKVDPALIEEAVSSGLPVVLIDFEYAALPAVLIDNQGGARAAARHLLDRGHRRIAFLGADMAHPSLNARRAGFQLACVEADLPANSLSYVVTDDGESDYDTGRALAERLLAMEDRPTAVFCTNDAMAFSVLDRATSLGLRIPEDLAVVGFDDVPHAEHSRPPLTTIRVQTGHLGELAMRYLVDLLEDSPLRLARPEREPHRITVPTELVIRSST